MFETPLLRALGRAARHYLGLALLVGLLLPEIARAEVFASGAVHYPARQKTQLYSGWYDAVSGSTFVVYAGGVVGSLSATSPYLVVYDHAGETWSAPRQVFPSPVGPDAHNYPQIILDDAGYLHVFHSFHANHPIRYARSVAPRDPTVWTIADLDGTARATYGSAHRSASGDIYLFFRHRDNAGGEADYEPEYYLKSSDDGATWSRTLLIDPVPDHPTGNDGWGTVYTKSMHQRSSPQDGVDIVFGIHRDHNLFVDAHYYVFFDFSNDTLYAADGTSLGATIDREEFKSCCLLFDHGAATPFYNVRTAVDVDPSGLPAVFHNQQQAGSDSLKLRRWNGSTWSLVEIGILDIEPYEVEVGASLSDAVLYAIENRRKVKKYTFVSDALESEETLFEIPSNSYRLAHLTFFRNALPGLKGYFFQGLQTPWATPSPSGTLISVPVGTFAPVSLPALGPPAGGVLVLMLGALGLRRVARGPKAARRQGPAMSSTATNQGAPPARQPSFFASRRDTR